MHNFLDSKRRWSSDICRSAAAGNPPRSQPSIFLVRRGSGHHDRRRHMHPVVHPRLAAQRISAAPRLISETWLASKQGLYLATLVYTEAVPCGHLV